MTEEFAEFRQEGENPFNESENENSESSQDETNDIEDTQADDGDNSHQEAPFNKHPRWQEREAEWNKRFNEQEARHQEDMKKIHDDFAGLRNENAENNEIPSWFGGTQDQWNDYRKWNDQQLESTENRALKRASESKSNEDKAIKEATDFMQSEIATIQSDKSLNPSGERIDPNKLVKFVIDNDLVDSQGRWNYKAGWRMMNINQAPRADKKVIAGAITSESKGESKPKIYKTTADFKSNRPW